MNGKRALKQESLEHRECNHKLFHKIETLAENEDGPRIHLPSAASEAERR